MNFNPGGTHTGTLISAPGATLNFGGGSHVLAAGPLVTGGSVVSLSGAATLSASGTFGAGSTLNLISAPVVLPLVVTATNVVITWSAVSNGTYRVQYEPSLNAPN